MNISDFLSPSDVLVDVSTGDKVGLLKLLSAKAAAKAGLDAEEITKDIVRRETLGSTGIGHGVALPHARIRGLKAPFGLLARLRHAIDFEAIDDQPVDIVLLLLLPDAPEDAQLNALACAARALRNIHRLQMVRRAPDRGALFQAITASAE
jgi:nitrogen PTS system EIIA component